MQFLSSLILSSCVIIDPFQGIQIFPGMIVANLVALVAVIVATQLFP